MIFDSVDALLVRLSDIPLTHFKESEENTYNTLLKTLLKEKSK